jgi:hypothetical protein
MNIKILKQLKTIFILIFFILITFSCKKNSRFDHFIYTYCQALIYKDVSLFRSILMTESEFKESNDSLFKKDYNEYINKNLLIFNNAIQNTKSSSLSVEKIGYGNNVNNYNIDLIYNTKIFLKDNRGGIYHTRILFITKTKTGLYKIFLVNH